MKAAVLRHQGSDLRIEEVALAPPAAGEVVVRVMATGICHSDLSVVRGKVAVPLPLVPGHEAAGIVEATGHSVTDVQPGDRVVLSWAPACGGCFFCARRHPTLCTVYGAAASTGMLWDGTSRLGDHGAIHHYSCVSSFAQAAVVPAAACVPLPDDVPFAIGALVGCAVTTGFGAVVNDAAVAPGDSVAVIGIGGVGFNALLAARVAGAATIVALDIDPACAARAVAAGATHFVDARAADAAEQVRALTDGRGVDHAIECTGHPAAAGLAYAATRGAGTVVIVGIAPQDTVLTFPATGFPGAKKRLIGSIYGGGVPAEDMARIFALYREGRLPLDAQIGACFPLDDVNLALRRMEAGQPGRAILEPNG